MYFNIENRPQIENQIEHLKQQIHDDIIKSKIEAIPLCLGSKSKSVMFEAIVFYAFHKLDEFNRKLLACAITRTEPNFSGFGSTLFAIQPAQKLLTADFNQFWNLICTSLNVDRQTSLLIMAKLLKITPEYCFEQSSNSVFYSDVNSNSYTPAIYPEAIRYNDEVYSLLAKIDRKNYSGCIIGYSLFYQNNDFSDYFFVFGSCIKENNYYVVRIGRTAPEIYMISDNLLGLYNTAKILLVPNPNTLIELVKIACESKLADKGNIIITAYPRDKNLYTKYHLNILAGREVCIVCSPGTHEWHWIQTLIDECTKAYISKLTIYPYPLIMANYILDLNGYSGTCIERLNSKKRELAKIDIMKNFAEQILQSAIPIDQFDSWKHEIGLNPADKVNEKNNNEGFEEVDIWSPDAEFIPIDSKNVSLRNFINNNNRTLIYGPSGVGKSTICVTLGLKLALGESFLCFKESNPCKVLYIDGERKDHLRKLPSRILGDIGRSYAQPKNNFEMVNIALDFAKADDRCRFIEALKSSRWDTIIFDNIDSIMPKIQKNFTEEMKKFFIDIEAQGTAIILVHHTSKESENYSGSSEIGNLAQNVISVLPVKSCDRTRTNLLPPGRIDTITIVEAKLPSDFIQKQINVLLQDNGPLMMLGDDCSSIENDSHIPDKKIVYSKNESERILDKSKPTYTPSEQELKIMRRLQKDKSVTRKMLDEVNDTHEQTTRTYLNRLKDNGYVAGGEVKGGSYTLTEKGRNFLDS